jgi:hypothetical protein
MALDPQGVFFSTMDAPALAGMPLQRHVSYISTLDNQQRKIVSERQEKSHQTKGH